MRMFVIKGADLKVMESHDYATPSQPTWEIVNHKFLFDALGHPDPNWELNFKMGYIKKTFYQISRDEIQEYLTLHSTTIPEIAAREGIDEKSARDMVKTAIAKEKEKKPTVKYMPIFEIAPQTIVAYGSKKDIKQIAEMLQGEVYALSFSGMTEFLRKMILKAINPVNPISQALNSDMFSLYEVTGVYKGDRVKINSANIEASDFSRFIYDTKFEPKKATFIFYPNINNNIVRGRATFGNKELLPSMSLPKGLEELGAFSQFFYNKLNEFVNAVEDHKEESNPQE